MTPKEKAAAAISTLTRQTLSGSISWVKLQPAIEPANANDKITDYYEAEVKGQRLAIYAGHTPHRDEGDEQPWWQDYVELVALDPERQVGWRFPRVVGAAELLDAVRYRSAGMDRFLDELIGP